MESRLPKPSGLPVVSRLKKPAATMSFVPTDRLVSNLQKFGRMPLSSSTNQNVLNINKRHASPELERKPLPAVNRTKLRRSRSACDLRENRLGPAIDFRSGALKRQGSTLATIPAKVSRSTNFLNGRGVVPAAAAAAKPKIVKSLSSSQLNAVASMTTLKTKASSTNSLASTKPAANNTAAATVRKAVKKIPAYDYKARFADLQERHKALKDKWDETQSKLEEYGQLGEQYEESQAALFRVTEELKHAKTSIECKDRQHKLDELKINSLTTNLGQVTAESNAYQEKCTKLTADNEQMSKELTELREESIKNKNLAKILDETQELLYKSNIDRKDLHNAVMDLRGNIRVFCRVRPPLSCEEDRQICGWQYLDETSLEISTIEQQPSGARNKHLKHDFSFDQVFHPRSSQEDIFELVSPLIQSALDGFNVCIFAYGQTGSGKTFTMDGIPSEVGIIPRTVDLLFDSVKNYKRLGWEYEIKATFLEIYNEVLYDLLSNETKDMEIRMVSAKNLTEIYVSNITEVSVANADSLRELMVISKSNRATASTVGNERSSRSHAVTRLELIGTHREKNVSCIGTINLVDLAGSESPKTSVRMEETKKINKSLSELTNVIMAILQKQEHIPYRNSKLTHLLMPCLGGNSKTLMFINVAPFQDCFVESVKSLRFAASVNSCKMTKAKKNKFLNSSNNQSGNMLPPATNSNLSTSSINSSNCG